MTLATNLMMQYWQQQNQLPPGYRRVEYLESTGEAYIDTGVEMADDLTISCRAQYKYRGATVVRGRAVISDQQYYMVFIVTGNSQTDVQGAYNQGGQGIDNLSVGISFGSWFDAELSNRKLIVNGKTAQTRAYTFPHSSSHLYIGGYYILNGSFITTPVVMATVAISSTSGNLRSFVPCVRIADNKPGLYDLCGSICPLTSSPFYINSGTGADFLWGELS